MSTPAPDDLDRLSLPAGRAAFFPLFTELPVDDVLIDGRSVTWFGGNDEILSVQFADAEPGERLVELVVDGRRVPILLLDVAPLPPGWITATLHVDLPNDRIDEIQVRCSSTYYLLVVLAGRMEIGLPPNEECDLQGYGWTFGWADGRARVDQIPDIFHTNLWFRSGDGHATLRATGPASGQVIWVRTRVDGAPGLDPASRQLVAECPSGDFATQYRFGDFVRFHLPDEACRMRAGTGSGQAHLTWAVLVQDGDGWRWTVVSSRTPTVAGHRTLLMIATFPSPLWDDTEFVQQTHRDFLGRDADPSTLIAWRSDLRDGVRTQAQLVAELAESEEFGGRIGSISRLYRAYFGRFPDEAGLRYWLGLMGSGLSLERISSEFAASAEFRLRYGDLTGDAFVDLVYDNVLGRSSDSVGRTYWSDQLAAGLTRGELMIGFSESAEYRSATDAEIVISALYLGLLQRDPDPAGFDYWVEQRRAGAGLESLIGALLESHEYEDRFIDMADPLPRSAGYGVDDGIGPPPIALIPTPDHDLVEILGDLDT